MRTMRNAVRAASTVALAVCVLVSGTPASAGGRAAKAGSAIALVYEDLEHYHGGYEVNLHVSGDGSFELWAVDAASSAVVMDHSHRGTAQASWATWYAATMETEFYVLLYDTQGRLRAVYALQVGFDAGS